MFKEEMVKSLFQLLIPDQICSSVYEIPFASYYAQGIRLLVFDIDNTLVSYQIPKPDDALKQFFQTLKKQGFSIAFVSNNEAFRVEAFNEELEFPAFAKAGKPLSRALRPLFEEMGYRKEEVLMIGDQLFTDVLAAKRWGALAVTVSPIKKDESLFFRLKRLMEKPLVRAYYRRKKKEEKK
jgi:HAD superfamily phosphatase (TIGR01668 family)